MKKLVIVSTLPGVGKGGISTALEGYISGLQQQNVEFEYVETHRENANTITTWCKAWFKLTKLAIKYRNNGIFWFHLGPWFSSIRKSSLALFPRMLGVKTVGHVHSPATKDYLDGSLFSRVGYKLLLMPYSSFIVLTPWWKEYLQTFFPKKEMLVCPNPNNVLDSQLANEVLQKKPAFRSSKNINILTMSRLVKGKNVDKVIEGLSHLPDNFTLTVAGDGEQMEYLQQLVDKENLKKRVKFVGWINVKQKQDLMSKADMFCLPSDYDSFGMVFIEAMANNLPVIALGWGPIYDVVKPEVGVLVDEANAEHISKAILDVEKKLLSYHLKGPEYVLNNFQSNKVVTPIIQMLNN